MTVWRLGLYELDGTEISGDLPWRDLTFGWVLDAPGGLEAKLRMDHAAITWANLAPGQRELRVLRNDVPVWGGYLWSLTCDPSPRVRDLTIRGEGYFSRVRRWFTVAALLFEGAPQQDIAWALIDHVQGEAGGAAGFTQGTHTGSSIARDRTYCAPAHIAGAIEELASMDDGIDFDIGPGKTFDTWQPRRGSSIAFTLGPAHYSLMDFDLDAHEVIARVLAQGGGDCSPPSDDRTDATALAAYGLLMEALQVDTDVQAEVEAHAREELRIRRIPRFQARVSYYEDKGPAWGTYGIGDVIALEATADFATFSKSVRVLSREITVQLGESDSDVAFFTELLDQVVS